MISLSSHLKDIQAFIFDIDGVCSQTTLNLDQNGNVMRTVNIKDGYALHIAVKKGYYIAIISGGDSEATRKRYKKLGINDIYLTSAHKKIDLQDFMDKHKLNSSQMLYMGDDIPDYEVMQMVGFPTCPADAAPEIKAISQYISDKEGGKGCVRDVIEKVLKIQNKWMDDEAFIW